MKKPEIILSDAVIDQIIADWEALKPKKPSRPEPIKLMVFLPLRPFWVTMLINQPFMIAMRITGWRAYRSTYRAWYTTLTDRLKELEEATLDSGSSYDDPRLGKLRRYVVGAGWHLDVGSK